MPEILTRPPATRQLLQSMRLRRSRDFERVFRNSCRSRDGLLTVLAAANEMDLPRLGLVIGKKHVRGAVGRNRVKRIVRESFRQRRALLGGLDIVVIGGRRLATTPSSALFRSLERHWQVLGERCNAS